jgi:hypothetical protein
MHEQNAVYLVYLLGVFLLYAVLSGRYISILAHRDAPRLVRHAIELIYAGQAQPSAGMALVALLGWTLFCQLAPVLVVLSYSPALLRIPSIIEVAAAIGWTIYLVSRRAS